MATRKKPEGLAAILPKQEAVSIQELTMQDFFAAFALQGLLAHHGDVDYSNVHEAAFYHAEKMVALRPA